MRRNLIYMLFLVITFIRCDDQIIETYLANVPVYISYDELRSSIKARDPQNIKNPGKIYFYENLLFINEYLKGVHVIDNSNPSAPQNLKFIHIPGNVDIAVKNGILYADSYVDLVAIDISDLNEIEEVNRLKEIFPYILPPYDENYRIDEIDYNKGAVIDWELKEVTRKVDERVYPVFPWYEADYMLSSYANGTTGYASGSNSFGIGGSMARFTSIQDVLYIVDSYTLKVIETSSVSDLSMIKIINIGWNIETLFPSGSHLFIGSQSGMIIYDISNPFNPTYVSDYWHVTSCDPVVVEGDYAYVTLRSGNFCGDTTNQLDVIDISNITNPNLVRSYSMTEPYGLGIDNSILFICDGSAGLKIYDANDVLSITENQLAAFPDIQTYDVIPVNGILMLIGNDGLYQYDYSDITEIKLLSAIPISSKN